MVNRPNDASRNEDESCLRRRRIEHNDIVNTTFFFLQPRHCNGEMTEDYVLGALAGIIFASPNSTL